MQSERLLRTSKSTMQLSLAVPILICKLLCVHGIALPFVFERAINDTTALSPKYPDIQRQLTPLLSKGASIYFPNSSQFENATSRWSAYAEPDVTFVVVPAVANDVATTVSLDEGGYRRLTSKVLGILCEQVWHKISSC